MQSCDIFCKVVDNYGDIGVCWRLARQLAYEHGIAVRLWVDDLHSFARLCADIQPTLNSQICQGIRVEHWREPFPEAIPAEMVIEAFACKLPPSYLAAMAAQSPAPLWLNVEYLSAEDWVEGCHGLPSPHPSLPLTKYFFFPGFTPKTGGLLLEQDLLARRDAFQTDALAQEKFWANLGVPARAENELRVSLFSYENTALPCLLKTWAEGENPLTCLLPEGRATPQVAQFLGQNKIVAGEIWQHGALRVHVLPFATQDLYDHLLWAADINFVRGEDSCVRAQWAGKPFVWHIYPQHDGIHLAKLDALKTRYSIGLQPDSERAVTGLWQAWNTEAALGAAWAQFAAQRTALQIHTQHWASTLAQNNLTLNLLARFAHHA
jgi:uncharacterized repeat protein (TIGR03837 family)